MVLNRDYYLNQLIKKINDKRIKIVTGLRRSGKSVLLNELFYNYLIKIGVNQDHIIRIPLDDYKYRLYKNPDELYNYVTSLLIDKNNYYLILDEIQLVDNFVDVLLGFYHIENLDVYVSGSNSKFLSTDIVSQFNDRGEEIRIYPFSFKEYYDALKNNYNLNQIYEMYLIYGGLPRTIILNNDEKRKYLNEVYFETYLSDLRNRHNIRNYDDFKELIKLLSSNVGSKFSILKLANSFKSIKKENISINTISKYIDYLKDAFLIDGVNKYNIKGKKIINSETKYYFTDIGIRNVVLDFNLLEETHLMEQLIYNELCKRDYRVFVGIYNLNAKNKDGTSIRKELEIDFIAEKNGQKLYIQSCLKIENEEKLIQELRPFKYLNDGYKKILIVKEGYLTSYTNDGYLILNLFDFLLKEDFLK